MGMNPNFEQIGLAFAKLYYERFDSNRSTLKDLYVSEGSGDGKLPIEIISPGLAIIHDMFYFSNSVVLLC